MSRAWTLTLMIWIGLTTACSDGPQRSFALPTAPTATSDQPPNPVSPIPPGPPIYPGLVGPPYLPGTGQPVGDGASIRFSINDTDVACYPNWDRTARCRLFELQPSIGGELVVNVRRTIAVRTDVLDLFVVSTAGDVVFALDGWDWEQASLPLFAGRRYGIFVMAYPPFPQEFTLDIAVN